MKNKLLDEARDLLIKAEKIVDPRQKRVLCDQVLILFEEILEDAQEDEMVVINNLRKSFARSLVNQIYIMNMDDVETASYFFTLLLNFTREVYELTEENPDFNEKFKWIAEQLSSYIEE